MVVPTVQIKMLPLLRDGSLLKVNIDAKQGHSSREWAQRLAKNTGRLSDISGL